MLSINGVSTASSTVPQNLSDPRVMLRFIRSQAKIVAELQAKVEELTAPTVGSRGSVSDRLAILEHGSRPGLPNFG